MLERRDVARLIKPLADRVALAIGRAVLRLVAEAPGVQLVQVEALAGEVIDRAEHLQAYGFASHPLPGAEAVLVAVGGARNHPLVIVIADRRHRPPLEAGETILHDDQGQTVHMARDRILIKTDKLLRIEAKEVEIHATDRVGIDAGGAGVTYFPDSTHDWRQGLPTVNHPPAPPEHSP